MFCKKCGYGVEEGMRFCTRCGAAVEMEEAQKSTVQMQPAGSVQSAFAPAASKTAPEQKKTSDPVQPKEFIQAAKKASAAPAKKPSVLPFVLPAAGLLLLSIILFAIFGPKKELSAEAAAEDGTARTAAVVNKPSGKPSEAAETAEEEEVTDPETTPGVQKKITVIVSDSFGPVEGAAVELIDENGEEVRTVATKEGGIATMTMVEAGTYVLHIAKKDYAEVNETITMDENTMAYDLAMERTLEHLSTTLTIHTGKITGDNPLGTVSIALYAGRDASEGEAYVTGTSDASGLCTFEDFPYGEFTLCCNSEQYCPLIKNIDVSEENGRNEYNVYLVPVPKAGEAYAVLDWDNADLDLDLCAFHSELREYVNVTHTSNQKRSFLYDDNKGGCRAEAIMLKDADSSAVQTIYVMDTTTAIADSRDSSMGMSGVHVTIYRRDMAPVTYTMAEDENALIWTVCSIQSNEVQEAAQYSTMVSDHIWAVDILESKKPAPTPDTAMYDDEDEEDY